MASQAVGVLIVLTVVFLFLPPPWKNGQLAGESVLRIDDSSGFDEITEAVAQFLDA